MWRWRSRRLIEEGRGRSSGGEGVEHELKKEGNGGGGGVEND